MRGHWEGGFLGAPLPATFHIYPEERPRWLGPADPAEAA